MQKKTQKHTHKYEQILAHILSLSPLHSLSHTYTPSKPETCSYEFRVRARRLDDLCLLLEIKVLPGEIRVDVLLVQAEDLVVGDRPGIGEVVVLQGDGS